LRRASSPKGGKPQQETAIRPFRLFGDKRRSANFGTTAMTTEAMTTETERLKDNVVALKGGPVAGRDAQAGQDVAAKVAGDDVPLAPQGRDAATEKPAPAADQGAEPVGAKRPHRRLFLETTSAFAAVVLLAAGYVYWDYSSHFQYTDDAFIDARHFTVSPKVPGYIVEVSVTDNQHVAAGDVIARIDDRDYRVAWEQAEAQVAVAAANIANLDAMITVQQAQITASQAQVEQAQAALTFAEQQAARYEDLAQSAAGTVQMAQQTAAALRQAQAALRNAQAALTVAQRQVDSLKAQRSAAEANLKVANAQRDQAELNLSYTVVTAAQAGRVATLTDAVGAYAQAGTGLATFVPDDIWVTGNYKETQLDEVRPGQAATVHIDAYPNRGVTGLVASVQPGSGTAFSLLPAQNATGNFVKIVQRVPVKIVLKNVPEDVTLGPGMSVEPSIRVRPAPSLYERIMGWL
jgi:membrane fusion protein (multidrug efflux system)